VTFCLSSKSGAVVRIGKTAIVPGKTLFWLCRGFPSTP
jgi:hypothetical protein